jgi:hypothetical protein
MQRIQLKADRAFDILRRHSGQRHLADNHFAARKQHRRADALRSRRFQEARIFRAPFRRGTLRVVFEGQPSQHADAGRPHPGHGYFEIARADLDADAGAEGEELAKVLGGEF